jgi:phosphoserine phosphatase
VAKRRGALLDWDGTLCSGATILAWTKHLHNVGVMREEGMKSVASAFQDFDRGKIDYLGLVDRATMGYARGLVGRRVEDIAPHAAGFAESYRDQIMWFAPELIAGILKANIEPIVITGSPAIAVNALAAPLGIENVIGLRPFVSRGHLTSLLPQNTARPEIKQQIVESFDGDILLGAGDSVSDKPLLAAAQVRIFVGDGPAPELDGIIRIPTIPSPHARKDLARVIAAVTELAGEQLHPPQEKEALDT